VITAAPFPLDLSRVRQDAASDAAACQRAFVVTWLCSAALVTLIRALHAVELRFDLALQVEAAQNLLNGRGLTTYAATSANIADPLTLVPLTHFPSGYTLCAAALMALGVPLVAVIKILGAVATMLGWWGFAHVAYRFWEPACRRDSRWRWFAYAFGAVTPAVYTMSWAGTDIFLWACIPWVLILLTRPPTTSSLDSRQHLIAGAVAGAAVLMRYAGVLVAAYAAVLIVWRSGTQLRLLARRAASFGLGLVPAVILQGWMNVVVARDRTSLGGVTATIDTLVDDGRWHHPLNLATANTAFLFWAPRRVLEFLTADTAAAQILGVVLLFALPALAIALIRRRSGSDHDGAVAVAATAFLPAVPLFLWLCEAFGAQRYSEVPRYYAPLTPLALIVIGFLATSDAFPSERLRRLGRTLGGGYLLAFLMVTAARLVIVPGTGELAANQRARLVGESEFRAWPSAGFTYDGSKARRYVAALMKAQPDAILLTNVAHWFYAEPTLDLSRIQHMTHCDRLANSELRGPARVFILASDLGGPANELYAFGERRRYRMRCLEGWPLTLVQSFPDEQLKLLEHRVPAGSRIVITGRRSK